MLAILQQFMDISDPDQFHTLDKDDSIKSMHFFWKGKSGVYLGCSDQLAKNLGFHKASEVLGYTDFDLCWAASAPHFKLNDDRVLYNKKACVVIETGKLSTGAISKALSYKSPLRLRSTNKVAGTICVAIEFDDENISFCGKKKSPPIDFFASYNLTDRQKECLYYLSRGLSMKQIAKKLMLSPRTVEHYLETVKNKLGCHSRAQLIDKILS